MTRALLTTAFKNTIGNAGFFLIVDAGGLTATLYKEMSGGPGHEPPPKFVGKLSYNSVSLSVDYDDLMRLIRTNA